MPNGRTSKAAHNSTGRSPYAVRTPTARAKLTNGTRGMVLPGIDQRSALARRYRDLVAQVAADQGGADRCSEARLQLIRRFAALSVQAEGLEARLANGEPIDVSEYAQLTSTLVRVVSRLGLGRIAKDITPTLGDILRNDLRRQQEDQRD
jgi:predicted ABC-class ATPase